MNRRHILGLGAAGALAPFATQAQPAAVWPTAAGRIVVPFAAGGPTDIPARLLADEMSKFLPNRLIV
ncbi:MAG TPA: tripartite tricarboxylate transporter substrate binding protein, partial [Roseomonas sp.]|nr:tripartite tricarboxylate transporter substrate binding protein [Roseomonas sp.]